MHEVRKWTVIFFIDSKKPTQIGLLKRSYAKSFASNFYTGIGGKIGDVEGFENETPLEGAYRELEEETIGELNADNVELSEFARCVHDTDLTIYYFWSICKNLPSVDESDGKLTWVDVGEVLSYHLIPTTKAVCTEWRRRNFSADQLFTVHVSELGVERTVRLVEVTKVTDELL
jgi:8-oxo-dGTP pyrophosphatase MutT (NUDIX family)